MCLFPRRSTRFFSNPVLLCLLVLPAHYVSLLLPNPFFIALGNVSDYIDTSIHSSNSAARPSPRSRDVSPAHHKHNHFCHVITRLHRHLVTLFQLDLILPSEEGDSSSFLPNGEWTLLGMCWSRRWWCLWWCFWWCLWCRWWCRGPKSTVHFERSCLVCQTDRWYDSEYPINVSILTLL